jgi:L-fuculose-phosphate aldolase
MAHFVENAAEEVLKAAKELLEKGLVEGTAGNISARREDGNIVITPSSLDYRLMTLEDLVVIDPQGETVEGSRPPSSEKLLHLSCLNAYDEIGCVIHSHARHASMFAVAQRDLPACIDEFSVYVGGDVRCTEYAMSGTPELGEQAVKALENRGAALIANHGMVAVGPNPNKVMHITALVERTAEIVWGASLLGPIHSLPDKVNTDFSNIYMGYMRTHG